MLAIIKNSAGKSLAGMLCFILRAHVKCRYAYSKLRFAVVAARLPIAGPTARSWKLFVPQLRDEKKHKAY
ncbi:hypothetical protein DW966_08630 [Bacteroides stercoris]|nr:hypothetical protein DW966_08630 [Bacteroides stercoris]